MRHYFLIVALGEIFYGVVLAQNSYNYGPNTDGNFPQNNPSKNWNQPPNQGGSRNGFQPRGGLGPRRQRKFRQPQPMNSYDYPTDQSRNQGYDNNWNPPIQGNDNTAYNGNYDTGQTDNGQGNNAPQPNDYTGQMTQNDPSGNNYDTGQTDYGQGNNAPQSNYDQIPGPSDSDDATTTAASTSGKKKKRRRRKRPPGSPPLRKRRRRRRKDPEDPQQVDDSDDSSKDGSSSNDDEVPPGIPNDYPGYTYPPEFFSDLLGGLDDDTESPDTTDQDTDKDTQAGSDSTGSEDLVPDDIPNDYPGFSYPPDFFTDLLEGLEDSTQPSDTNGPSNPDDVVATDTSQGDTRTIETTSITKTVRKRKKRPPGSKRKRRHRGKSTSSTPADNDDEGGQGNDDQSGDDDSATSSSTRTPQDYSRSIDDSGYANATDFLDYIFPGVDNSSDANPQKEIGGKENSSSGFNMDNFLKEFKDRLHNRNRNNKNNPDDDGNSSQTESSTYSNQISSSDENSEFDPTTENTTKRKSYSKHRLNRKGNRSSNESEDNNEGNSQDQSQQDGSNDSTHKSSRSADDNEDQDESPTESQNDDQKNQSDVTQTEDTVTYSNSTHHVVTDGYKTRRNGTRRLRTRPPGNGTRTKRKRKKKLRRKPNSFTTLPSNPQREGGVPPGLPNDYPDYQFPPGFFDDLLDGLNVSTAFDDGVSSTEDYSGDEDTQLENPPGDNWDEDSETGNTTSLENVTLTLELSSTEHPITSTEEFKTTIHTTIVLPANKVASTTTTKSLTTSEIPTTTETPTTTTEAPTTTTEAPTTTAPTTTTEAPTTTTIAPTTTTEAPTTTTEAPTTTTEAPTTTTIAPTTTTIAPTTTTIALTTTTEAPKTTTEAPTTTTEAPTTTTEAPITTTEVPTTTTEAPTTTTEAPITTTEAPTTTTETPTASTEAPTSTEIPKTTTLVPTTFVQTSTSQSSTTITETSTTVVPTTVVLTTLTSTSSEPPITNPSISISTTEASSTSTTSEFPSTVQSTTPSPTTNTQAYTSTRSGNEDNILSSMKSSTPSEEASTSSVTSDIYETSTEGEMKYLPPDQVNDFTLIEPPSGVVCNANESYYKCVPHCKHTCFNYDSDEMCPVFCQPGCGCDRGLLIDEKGQCVHPDDCFELSCGLDEEWWDCKPTCHNTCKNFARAEACEDVECESGCFCRDGLILDSDGNCVEPEDCEDPTCHENEEETDCISPCNTCAANCRSCQFRSCREGCDCKDGFKRDSKGECIHASLCPACSQPSSTLAPSTPEQ